MSRMNTIDMQTTEWGVMDYRKNPITVEQFPTQFVVTLTFNFMITNETIDVNDTRKVASAWCKQHTAEAVIEDLRYMLNISSAKWIGSNVLEFVLPLDSKVDGGYKVTALTLEEIHDQLVTNSLEDGSYEGMPGESFWIVPCSFASKF